MIHSTKNLAEKSIPVSITQAALKIARFFADEQVTLEKRNQVYLNTLAVCAVNDYMEMMNIPTDPKASDSWNCAMHYYADVADLKLSGLGYLECRPVSSGNLCYIPPEVPDDRIGVVVVELDIEHQQATLIGFAKTVKAGELLFNELQTIEDLLAYIDSLESNAREVKLSYWLQNIIDAGWQPIEKILASKTPQLAFRYRNGVTRGKLIDMGIELPGQSLALVITLTPKNSVEIQLKLQVHPSDEQAYLPNNLIVKVLDEKGINVMEAHARSGSTYVTLEFNAQIGERFSVNLELGNTNIIENFVI
ncbi:DUF1822 family protein [Nostoc sp. ChiVER01]|uniref:DUF1822 family protein n=1 Tax=Nostoc sp. ChiVER01 TaxID=3075382 RepID=UPI002AD33014|nr:DUF1822 family protein [Nostoc sp. ChiVER01]MDZ8223754.1 DUF1822 family protein [Nostoc sp. ChiVER01]